eukprot:5911413-Alexandrium_andersonii.AAC.1
MELTAPPWTHLVVQAATLRGTIAPHWGPTPGHPAHKRIEGAATLRHQLPQNWELNPFRMLDPKMAAPSVIPTHKDCRRDIYEGIYDAERAWRGQAGE